MGLPVKQGPQGLLAFQGNLEGLENPARKALRDPRDLKGKREFQELQVCLAFLENVGYQVYQ